MNDIRGLEFADIVQAHGAEYQTLHGRHAAEQKVLSDIVRCRTAALGGHCARCGDCGHEEISYNSCRNRHCPKCLGSKTGRWLRQRVSELLPVPYFHCVFTLPAEFRLLALQHKTAIYDLLFQAASEALNEAAKNPRYLGAQIGFFGILHTWTQALEFHPHIHFVVAAGGVAPDGTWRSVKRKRFFIPVRVLSRLFQGKFLDYLRRAAPKHGILPTELEPRIAAACAKRWVVYCKRPFAGPEVVLKYLSRYTHRIAISNRRIVSLKDGVVRFMVRNHDHPEALSAPEFLRRFLLHIVPRSFTRIRHFGFLANTNRKSRLAALQKLLQFTAPPVPRTPDPHCSKCHSTTLVIIARLNPTFPIAPHRVRSTLNARAP